MMKGKRLLHIPPGNHDITIDDPKLLGMMKKLLKSFNYQTVEDIFNLCIEEETNLEEVEEHCDGLVKDDLMWCYTLNGEKHYVLRSDKKPEIKEMIKEVNEPEGDPSGEEYEVK